MARKKSAPECPVECGGGGARGAQSLFGLCPNVGGIKRNGSSLSISQPLCMITLTHRTEYNNFILVSLKPYNNDSPRFRSNPVTVIRLIRTIVLLLQLLNFISSQKYLVCKRKFIIDKLIFEPGERVVDNHTGHFSCLSTRHRGGKENFYSLLLVVLDQIVPPTFL